MAKETDIELLAEGVRHGVELVVQRHKEAYIQRALAEYEVRLRQELAHVSETVQVLIEQRVHLDKVDVHIVVARKPA